MHFNVQDKYFKQITSGLKTAEGRIDKPKFKNIKVGDIITFSPNNNLEDMVSAEITYLKRFPNFKKMLENQQRVLLPNIKDIAAGVSIYESFASYKADQYEFGVISIGFKLKKQKPLLSKRSFV